MKDGCGQKIEKPKRLPEAKIEHRPPRRFDNPGCCDKVFMVVSHNGKFWAYYVESGGPGMKDYDEPVYFCPFCGTKLDEGIPVAKR